MVNNYFILCRLALNLTNRLKNAVLVEAFSQEKDRLMLVFHDETGSTVFYEFSCMPQDAGFNERKHYGRAKRNTMDFFQILISHKFIGARIAIFERMIALDFDNASLFFLIHGKQTNVILWNGNELSSFKKADEECDYLSKVTGTAFFPVSEILHQLIHTITSLDETFTEKLVSLGKEGKKELIYRNGLNGLKSSINLISMINEYFFESLQLRLSLDSGKFVIVPASFNIDRYKLLKESDSPDILAQSAIIERSAASGRYHLLQRVSRQIETDINFLEKKIEASKKEIAETARSTTYRLYGDLILAHSNEISQGLVVITLPDFYNSEILYTVKLNPLMDSFRNAEYYYTKARNTEIRQQKIAELLPALEQKYSILLKYKTQINDSISEEDLEKIASRLKMGKVNTGNENAQNDEAKFRRFIVEEKYLILVGKDAHNNDVLTMKTAKPNDLWFHARGCSGSHVIIRVNKGMDKIPKNIVQAAASLAAFYSKAKTSKMAPVAYTEKKFVTKRKGMDPGQVLLMRESVIMVKPEIPAICIPYSGSDSDGEYTE
ncbi:MAG: NFACT RNA binding domain-containing protein [Ignavibacteria bacterium]|nr:NFACT RNA binding domain-containing protein [Ignavibacteria bacterium]